MNRSGTDGSSATGAASASAALDGFLKAANSGDLQAMSTFYGTGRGAIRDLATSPAEREAMEKKLVILECHFRHDRNRVVGTPRQRPDTVTFTVELTKGGLRGQTDVITVRGPASRWYVMDPRIDGIQPFCRGTRLSSAEPASPARH